MLGHEIVKCVRIPSVGSVKFLARLDNSLGISFCNLPLYDVVDEYDSERQRRDGNPEKGNSPARTLDDAFHDTHKEPYRTDQIRRQKAPG